MWHASMMQTGNGQVPLYGIYLAPGNMFDPPDISSLSPNPVEFNGSTISIGVQAVIDADDDSIPDFIDNCPNTVNSDQTDTDDDGQGNACDTDDDNDGVDDISDAFPLDDSEETDTDNDGIGDKS